jgi:plastocyanin
MYIATATHHSGRGDLSILLISFAATLALALFGLPWLPASPLPAGATGMSLAQDPTQLPPVELDALDGNRWSLTSIEVAPGQVIRITNRGAMAHDFTVDEWGVSVTLPTLETVEVTVPTDLSPGQQFTYYCTEPGHAVLGQTGTITIVTPEQVLASQPNRQGSSAPERVVIQTGDDFSFSPSSIEVTPGQVIEVQNNGVLQHHFVVDEWAINETISPGEVKLVQIPADVRPGDTFVFYCSVPGHQAGGMQGDILILDQPDSSGDENNPPIRSEADLGRFLPSAEALGTGWALVRTGNARAVLPDYDNVSPRVFPGEGRGATYVGPAGSRTTVIVLPFAPLEAPANQIEDAVLAVQLMMMVEWEADLRQGDAFNQIAPPTGCDAANRASGITRVYTLPAGSTVCQLRSVGVAIFVAVEGQYSEWSGVEAADQVIARLLQRATIWHPLD